MTWTQTDQPVELRRCENGCDYGTPRHLMARKGRRQVEFRPGCKYWVCLGEQGYSPATVTLSYVGSSHHYTLDTGRDVGKGRLSRAKLAALAPQIAAWLGVDVGNLPALGRRVTFVWKEQS